MKFLIALVLILGPITDLDKIAKVNKAKKEAKEAFLANNYQLAHDTYKFLIDSLGVNEEEVLLDYAHSLYNLNDTSNAVTNYEALSESINKNIASIAEQQLGQVLFDKKQYEPALEHYKNALRKNPNNQDARYNYELLKKMLKKQEEEQKDQQDKDNKDQKDQDKDKKDQEKQDQEQKDQEKKDGDKDEDQEKKEQQEKKDQEKKDQEQKDQEKKEGEKSEEKEKEKPKPSPSDKLKEMNISEEKAQMILEAMKNKEIQYIQQNRRKATKKKDSDKPDW